MTIIQAMDWFTHLQVKTGCVGVIDNVVSMFERGELRENQKLATLIQC